MSEANTHTSQRIFGSAFALVGRRVVITAMTATATAIVARLVHAGDFGAYASATATLVLFQGATDFGFSLVVARELAQRTERRGALLAAAMQVTTGWSLLAGLGFLVLAAIEGPSDKRFWLLIALAPILATTGVTLARQAFLVTYETKRLVKYDVGTNLLFAVASVALVKVGAGVLGVALAFTASSFLNATLVAWASRALIPLERPTKPERAHVMRAAAPLGISSFLMTAYFSVDLFLLGWLVAGAHLGDYAAATKILNLLVVVPGLAMTAALPGLSIAAARGPELGALASRLWHLLMVTAMPICIATMVFSQTLIDLAFGHKYTSAAPLLTVLAAAGAVAVLSNLLATILVAHGMGRAMIAQSVLSLVVNVSGNLILVPHYGVTAAAWLTLISEVIVTLGSIFLLRSELPLAPLARVSIRPTLAMAAAVAVGLLPITSAITIPAAALAFALVLTLLRAWPHELRPARLKIA